MAPRLLGGRLCKRAAVAGEVKKREKTKKKKEKNPEKLYVRTSPYLHNLPKANEAAQGVRVIVISVWERQKDH